MIGAVKFFALSILIALQCACETEPVDRYNRRGLYSAERGLVAPTPTPAPETKPQFR